MKRILCVLLAMMMLCLCGCGKTVNYATIENAYEILIAPFEKNDYYDKNELSEIWGENYSGKIGSTTYQCECTFGQFDDGTEHVESVKINFGINGKNSDYASNLEQGIVDKIREKLDGKTKGELSYTYQVNTVGIGIEIQFNDGSKTEKGDYDPELAAEIEAKTEETIERVRKQKESERAIEDNRSWLITAAQKAVKSQLSDPNSANFPFFSDGYPIVDMGNGVYAVTVEAEHKNEFGGVVQSTFVVRLSGSSIRDYTIVGIARM